MNNRQPTGNPILDRLLGRQGNAFDVQASIRQGGGAISGGQQLINPQWATPEQPAPTNEALTAEQVQAQITRLQQLLSDMTTGEGK